MIKRSLRALTPEMRSASAVFFFSGAGSMSLPSCQSHTEKTGLGYNRNNKSPTFSTRRYT